MSVNLTIAGTTYAFPTVGENNWGQVVTNWATAVSTSLLQRTGGTFSLTNEVDFGANFATKQAYIKTRTANPATAGFGRLARADVISWRNQANGANLDLGVNASNQITFDGVPLLSAPSALTASRALVSDSNGDIVVSTTTAAEILFVNGVTSAIQTQLNAKIGTTLASANILVGNGSNVATAVAMTGDISITNGGVTAYAGTVPIAKGGTGQIAQTAAFDALSPVTTRGDLITRDASNNVRLAVGAAGKVLRSDGTDPAWAYPSYNYTAQTSGYSAVANDFVNCTSGTFSVTLPTAVGCAGERIGVCMGGATLVTLATTSGQTIGSIASAVIKLGTTKDSIVVVSDGANWKIESFNVNISVRASLTTATSGIASSVIVFNNEEFDVLGQYNNATGVFTCQVPGTYKVTATALVTDVTSSTNCTLQVRKNGSGTKQSYGAGLPSTSDTQQFITIDDLVVLANGDTVDIFVNGDASFALDNNSSRTMLSIYRTGN